MSGNIRLQGTIFLAIIAIKPTLILCNMHFVQTSVNVTTNYNKTNFLKYAKISMVSHYGIILKVSY